jgi:hypothetical protein
LAAGAGQAGGDLKQMKAPDAGGLDGPVGEAEPGAAASEVVRQRGCDHGPGAVGGEPTGREVREGLVFEVADRELDRGVIAMIDIGGERWDCAVGRKRVVAPVGEQLGLRAEEAGCGGRSA